MFLLIRMATLQYYKVYEDAFDPILPYPNYPGFQLRSALEYCIKAGQKIQLRTDIIVKISSGYYGKVTSKPGLGNGVTLIRSYIESNKPTKVEVSVVNSSTADITIKRGQIIAILSLSKIETPQLIQRESFADLVDLQSLPVVEICKTDLEAFLPIEVEGGYVLRSLYHYEINPGCREVVSCGNAFKFPEGFYGCVEPTDAQTWLWKVTIMGGEVLTNSRREVRFLIGNTGDSIYKITPGDKIGILRLKKLHVHKTRISSRAEMDVLEDEDHVPPKKAMRINDGLSFKIMIVLRSVIPDSEIAEQFIKGIRELMDELFKDVRFDRSESNKIFTHCVKEYNDRCITFNLSLFGDCFLGSLKLSDKYLIEKLEAQMKQVASSLSLKCFIRVIPVKGSRV